VASARTRAKEGIIDLCRAVDAYIIQNGGMAPKTLGGLLVVDQTGQSPLPGAKTIPLDPWGHEYGYEPPTNDRDYRVYTLGRDGKPGGNGEDMDIDNYSMLAAGRR
jgi:general secretion pathway protein G